MNKRTVVDFTGDEVIVSIVEVKWMKEHVFPTIEAAAKALGVDAKDLLTHCEVSAKIQ